MTTKRHWNKQFSSESKSQFYRILLSSIGWKIISMISHIFSNRSSCTCFVQHKHTGQSLDATALELDYSILPSYSLDALLSCWRTHLPRTSNRHAPDADAHTCATCALPPCAHPLPNTLCWWWWVRECAVSFAVCVHKCVLSDDRRTSHSTIFVTFARIDEMTTTTGNRRAAYAERRVDIWFEFK